MQTGLSAALGFVMVAFVMAVWTGVVDLEGDHAPSPSAARQGNGTADDMGSDAPATGGSPQWEVSVPPNPTLWLTFDMRTPGQSGEQRFLDVDGRWQGIERSTGDRDLALVPGPPGRGVAVRTPPVCPQETGCPSAVVEVPDAAELDAGSADFSYGASVRMVPGRAAAGGNVVQKGWLQADGGQWTLHVDALGGQPSCVVEGVADGETQVLVRSTVTVADGAWHSVVCHKTAEAVEIVVDGRPTRLPEAAGTVRNAAPLVIGGSGQVVGDTQFHGSVDDVFFWVDGSRGR